MILDYVALTILFFVVLTLIYGVIEIHDIPYKIAKARDHPQQGAIQATGWVSLFTLHVIWPFLWIWAMAYRPDHGWGTEPSELQHRVAQLETRLEKGGIVWQPCSAWRTFR